MRTAHRDIHARLIDRDQPPRIEPRIARERPRGGAECRVGRVHSDAAVFFKHISLARHRPPEARRDVLAVRPTRRLYSRHSSSLVPSGRSRTTAEHDDRDRRPPAAAARPRRDRLRRPVLCDPPLQRAILHPKSAANRGIRPRRLRTPPPPVLETPRRMVLAWRQLVHLDVNSSGAPGLVAKS